MKWTHVESIRVNLRVDVCFVHIHSLLFLYACIMDVWNGQLLKGYWWDMY